jgi:ubiquinone/menaquinone biosynthesis C-methylase UbiE
MAIEQKNIWLEHSSKITVESIIEQYKKPAIFQVELNEVLQKICNSESKVLEIGCESGISSFLINNDLDKYLLDLNLDILEKSNLAAKKICLRNVNFINADMFYLPFKDETFDLVFNAGVVEHFNYSERVLFLHEYARVLKKDGFMVIAFPNHFSIPYKIAYMIYNLTGKWMFPKEKTIYKMKKELKRNNLILTDFKILSYGSIYNWLNFSPLLKNIFIKIGKFINFQGYLRVLIIKKNVEKK